MAFKVPREATDSLASGAFAAVTSLRGEVGMEVCQCRYPLGWPHRSDFTFCKNDTLPFKAYCLDHLALATRDPSTGRNF